jgi:hypothetical protein
MSGELESDDIVEAVNMLARRIGRVADAITPNICGSVDATGSHIESLTEAVMGITTGLFHIGDAIENLAAAVDGLRG